MPSPETSSFLVTLMINIGFAASIFSGWDHDCDVFRRPYHQRLGCRQRKSPSLGPFDCDVGAVLTIAFSPDGKMLISGKAHLRATSVSYVVIAGNEDTTVRSWTLQTPISDKLGPLSTYSGRTSPVRADSCLCA